MAHREALGDLKLSIAFHSRHRLRLGRKTRWRFSNSRPRASPPSIGWQTDFTNDQAEPIAVSRVLKMENREANGLGLPLPAGSLTLYTERDGRPFLLGEGSMADRAVGESVEVNMRRDPGVTATQRQLGGEGKEHQTELVVTNDQASSIRFEARFYDGRPPLGSSDKLAHRDGAYWLAVTIPANSSRTLTVRYGDGD